MKNESSKIIRTSESGWLKALAKLYRDQSPATIIDDANVGVDPSNQSLFDMSRSAKLSKKELAAVCISCGMSGFGLGLIWLAFIDPEPTSKLVVLLLGGVLLIGGGGYTAVHILTGKRPPNIKVGPQGIDISWN